MPDAGPKTPEAGERIQGPPADSTAVKGDGHVPTSRRRRQSPTAGAGSASFLSRQDSATIANILHTGGIGILDQLPDGVALLNHELRILWCNRLLYEFTLRNDSRCAGAHRASQPCPSASSRGRRPRPSDTLVGKTFYEAFGTPEIIGPDFCPLHTALGSGELAKSSLRVGEKTYFEVQARPVSTRGGRKPEPAGRHRPRYLGRSAAAAEAQRDLPGGAGAGRSLARRHPADERRRADRPAQVEDPALHAGSAAVRNGRNPPARQIDTSIWSRCWRSGWIPAPRRDRCGPIRKETASPVSSRRPGKSYLCEDTTTDPLYLPGAPGARSSLTVPLILHDEILGTFNVESPRPGAFNENDLQFLELFSREVAVALNTFELLAVEKMTTVNASTERILREVATPVDEILNDAACILERYIGHEPIVSERLQRILKHTRNIKQLIQKVGETFAPRPAHVPLMPRQQRPLLRGKRILVVDADEWVRSAAHELLGRYGCEVETAHNAEEAFVMVRSFHYDAVLADIRLPDMTGFECFYQLKQINEHLAVILMTGFGYDPAHSIVKARQHGLKSVLYKPFRLEQLLTEVEKAVSSPADVASSN